MNRRSSTGYLVLALTILAGVVRSYRLGSNSLWVDEVLTAQAAALDLRSIISESILQNSVPPFYFWLVHFSVWWFGSSEASLRLVSAIAGALTVPLFYLLVREWATDSRPAFVAAALLALNPLHLWYSQEARAYALLTLFECGALLFVCRAIRTGARGAWVAAWGFLVLAFLTHSFGVTLLAVLWAWAVFSPLRERAVRSMALLTVAYSIAIAPFALPLVFRSEVPHPPARSSLLEVPYAVYTYVAGYSFGASTREIQNLGAVAAIRESLGETVVATMILFIVGGLIVHRPRRSTLQGLLLLVLPLAITAALSRLTVFPFNVRFTLPSLLGLLGLTAIAVCMGGNSMKTLLVPAVLVVFIVADVQWFLSPRYWKEDSRGAVAWFSDHVRNGGKILVAPGYMSFSLSYYLDRLGSPARLTFVEYEPGEMPEADGLAVSREHHVTDPRRLEDRFLQAAFSPVVRGEVVGYRLFASAPEKRH